MAMTSEPEEEPGRSKAAAAVSSLADLTSVAAAATASLAAAPTPAHAAPPVENPNSLPPPVGRVEESSGQQTGKWRLNPKPCLLFGGLTVTFSD